MAPPADLHAFWSEGYPEALATLDDEKFEIDIFHRYSDWYGTAFFVLRDRAEA